MALMKIFAVILLKDFRLWKKKKKKLRQKHEQLYIDDENFFFFNLFLFSKMS